MSDVNNAHAAIQTHSQRNAVPPHCLAAGRGSLWPWWKCPFAQSITTLQHRLVASLDRWWLTGSRSPWPPTCPAEWLVHPTWGMRHDYSDLYFSTNRPGSRTWQEPHRLPRCTCELHHMKTWYPTRKNYATFLTVLHSLFQIHLRLQKFISKE